MRDNLQSIHREGEKFGAVDQVQDGGYKDFNQMIPSVPPLKQKHPLLIFKPPYNEAEEIKFTSDYQKVLSAAQVWVPSPTQNTVSVQEKPRSNPTTKPSRSPSPNCVSHI